MINLPNPDSSSERRVIDFNGEQIDEQIAPFVADLINDTAIEFLAIRVQERTEQEGASPRAEFVFADSDEGSMFLSMLGTLWPETQEKFKNFYLPENYREGWGISPTLIEVQNHEELDECDDDCDEDCDGLHESEEHTAEASIYRVIKANDDEAEEQEGCDCGMWHIHVGVAISIPVDTTDEFSRRLRNHLVEDEDKPDLRREFDGIAGLDEFL